MVTENPENQILINEWTEAYIAANGHEPGQKMYYEMGYFCVGIPKQYRRDQIKEMTKTLRLRAQNKKDKEVSE